MFKTLKTSVASFIEDREGNFAIMFACVASAVMISVGVAVDYTRMVSAQSEMQSILDVALLSTTQDIALGKINPADAQTAVNNFIASNINTARYDVAAVKLVNFKFDPKTVRISAGINTDLPLAFANFLGKQTALISVNSVAKHIERKVEVSMVLDVTGSMGDSNKIADLKVAAKAGVKEFIDNGGGNTRVAIVPYSFGVNAGALKQYVRDERGNPTTDACATERRGSEMFTDAGPLVAKVTRADKINYVEPGNNQTLDLYCPSAPVLPLTKDKAALNKTINSLSPVGGTAGHIGLQWGRYMLSPDWKAALPAPSEPAEHNTPNVEKFLILMTDGMFNSEASGLSDTSVPSYAGISALSGRLAMTNCKAIKAQNVKIYTIGFRLKDIAGVNEKNEAMRLLADCASTPAAGETTFFDADNSAELTAAFTSIARRVESVALTN